MKLVNNGDLSNNLADFYEIARPRKRPEPFLQVQVPGERGWQGTNGLRIVNVDAFETPGSVWVCDACACVLVLAEDHLRRAFCCEACGEVYWSDAARMAGVAMREGVRMPLRGTA